MNTSTRGERNNNPGNIRINPNQNWLGMILGDDPKFVKFKDPIWGIRALGKILITYRRKDLCTSIRNIINRWAPPSDNNNTEAYISAVCKDAGNIDPNVFYNVELKDKLKPLVKAIIIHENGRCIYSDTQLDEGVSLALGNPPTIQIP